MGNTALQIILAKNSAAPELNDGKKTGLNLVYLEPGNSSLNMGDTDVPTTTVTEIIPVIPSIGSIC